MFFLSFIDPILLFQFEYFLQDELSSEMNRIQSNHKTEIESRNLTHDLQMKLCQDEMNEKSAALLKVIVVLFIIILASICKVFL